MTAETIRVRGLVQGVGFRPTVWRLARECGLVGDVRNDGEGVLVRAWADGGAIDSFCRRLQEECPPLARIDSLERGPLSGPAASGDFRIVASAATEVRTGVVADAATCGACRGEIFDPADRRYRYPFTNCTHCGPRLSIIRGIPYDRANTSMSAFPLCDACRAEYEEPADRRFHAQPNACPVCGPRVWLEDAAGVRVDPAGLGAEDAVAAAGRLLEQGCILAVKGIGGFHLACDAGNERTVTELRRRKRRGRKPFALMAREPAVIRHWCRLNAAEEQLLRSSAAPIVLLDAQGPQRLAADIAPGQRTLGFMLPYSPLHHLLLAGWERPLVMTSGNLSEEPQCIDNADAGARLHGLADYYLLHDREIVNRVDDSVVRLMDGAPRLLRRARGYAPAPIALPEGFGQAPPILALGGELKNTICLLREGQAILSQHLGDLEEARTAAEQERTIALYGELFQHRPRLLVVDRHPDYRSTRFGRDWAQRDGLELLAVQHHFAHIAGVMADNGRPLEGGKVLGIALDGLGYGADGGLWGGEFLLADYRGFDRLGHLKAAPMPGGAKAVLEPWRNVYAQIATHFGWDEFRARYPDLEITGFLAEKPLAILEAMLSKGINSPLTSSCGRLFDAVAAVLGSSRDRITYEGQAAIELEALAAAATDGCGGYPFARKEDNGLRILDPAPLWEALFDDLARGVKKEVIAARFHSGLAEAVADLACTLATEHGVPTVALSGGVFQNRTLFEAVAARLRSAGLQVLAHRRVPANDGGLALGQAAVAAAWLLERPEGAGPRVPAEL
jgi:hydrogenase maturation protein HypF